MNKDIEKFYKLILNNDQLIKNLQEKLKNVHSKEAFNKFIKSEIIPLAKEKNYTFTAEDLIKYENKSLKNLSEEDLMNISGGVSPKSAILTGGIFSLILLGAGAYGSSTAHAAVLKDTILNSTDFIESPNTINTSSQTSNTTDIFLNLESSDDTTSNVNENVVPPINEETDTNLNLESSDDADFNINENNSHIINEETKINSNLELNTQDTNLGFTQNTHFEIELKEQAPNKELSKNDILNSANIITEDNSEEIKSYDTEYVLDSLNLLEPYIYNLTGTTKNFRFLDGYKKEIHVGNIGTDDIASWDFKYDSGSGSPNFMRCLFPSSGGILSSEGGATDVPSFSRDCNPTPEMVAKIAGYIYNYIRCTDKNVSKNAKKELDDILDSWAKHKFDNRILSWLIERLPNNINSLPDLERYIVNLPEGQQIINLNKQQKGNFTSLLNRLNASKFYTYSNANDFLHQYKNSFGNIVETNNKVKNFFKNYLNSNVDLKNISNIELYTNLYLLQNAEFMINNQEMPGYQEIDERTLPKYTTERMLMSYFIQHFNSESEVKRFYDETKKLITSDKGNPNLKNKLKRFEYLKTILSKFSKSTNCPYTETLVSNDLAKLIEITPENKLKFSSDTFADCADIAVRHIINLLSYNYENQWEFVLGQPNEQEIESLRQESNKVLNAINKNGTLENKPLKERLKLFFYYQSVAGANSNSIETRSFWNYVISNMDTNDNSFYPYKIRYSNSFKGNELDTGWLNCLKIIYNIVDALKCDDDNYKDLLKNSRDSINTLEETLKNNKDNRDNLQEALKEAITATFSTMANIDNNFAIDKLSIQDDEIYAEIYIDKDDISFPIVQDTGHAYVEFIPLTIESFNENDKHLEIFLQQDNTAQLLCSIFNLDSVNYANSVFNLHFGPFLAYNENILSNINKNFIDNSESLQFLKDAQGEGNNYLRILNLLIYAHHSSNINVIDKHGNKSLLSYFIFNNYVKDKEQIINFLNLNEQNLNDNIKDFINENKYTKLLENKNNKMLCKIKPDDTVSLLFLENNSRLIVPKEINLNNKVYPVTGIIGAVKDNIDEIIISDGIKNLTIEDCAFNECSNLKKFIVAKSVESLNIGNYAFAHSGLQLFDMPTLITSLTIGNSAFDSTNLSNFNVPTTITTLAIGKSAFSNSKLNTFIVPESVTSLDVGNFAFADTMIETFYIPNSVLHLNIGNYSFVNTELYEFIFPESLISLNIGDYAFERSNLSEITIPASVTALSIGNYSFLKSSISKFTVLGHIKSLFIGDFAFSQSNISEFIIPDSITHLSIGNYAFEKSNISIFNVPESVTYLNIGNSAFIESEITNFIMSNESVLTLNIGEFAFSESKISNFFISESVVSLNIGSYAFSWTGIQEFHVPKSATSLYIGSSAFAKSDIFNFAIESNSIASLKIRSSCFTDTDIFTFVIPESVVSLDIESYAFADAENLSSFIIPESVTSLNIGDFSFCNCPNLKTFIIPKSVTNLHVGNNSFDNRVENGF